MDAIVELKRLYGRESKHSNYQILSNRLSSIIGKDQVDVHSRYERERFDYMLDKISIKGKSILDIGGNSGFFTFESIESGAGKVHYFEGNKAHADFVKLAAEVLGCSIYIKITNDYYNFKANGLDGYDIVFLLNIIHHIGDDYDADVSSVDVAKRLMMKQLNSIAEKSDLLVFQLGFNWKGNRNKCLFEKGTKKELIEFITGSTAGVWEIMHVGIPVRRNGSVVYADLDDINIARDDSLGEFLNRPLFIMRSRS